MYALKFFAKLQKNMQKTHLVKDFILSFFFSFTENYFRGKQNLSLYLYNFKSNSLYEKEILPNKEW